MGFRIQKHVSLGTQVGGFGFNHQQPSTRQLLYSMAPSPLQWLGSQFVVFRCPFIATVTIASAATGAGTTVTSAAPATSATAIATTFPATVTLQLLLLFVLLAQPILPTIKFKSM
jgi:hypothetical protein